MVDRGYGIGPEVRGAGGVVWRRVADGRLEVVLVHHSLHRDWSVPKGKQDPGESLAECAVREVEEETGLACAPDQEIARVHYIDRLSRTKAVHYWSMHAGDLRPEAVEPTGGVWHTLTPTMEIDDAKWAPLPYAISEVNLPRDRCVLWSFAGHMGLTFRDLARENSLLAKLTRRAPLLVVRHASAGDRYGFGGDDRERPLDPKGEAQSTALAARLAGFPVERIVTSPAARCLQTVEPLAERTGVVLEVDERLGEGQGHRVPELIDDMRASGGVACTHGDVLDEALRWVAGTCDLPLPGDGGGKKAATWVLNGNGNGSSSAPPFRIAGYLAPPPV